MNFLTKFVVPSLIDSATTYMAIYGYSTVNVTLPVLFEEVDPDSSSVSLPFSSVSAVDVEAVVSAFLSSRSEQAVMEIIIAAVSKRAKVFMCFRLSIFVVSLLVYETSIGGEP